MGSGELTVGTDDLIYVFDDDLSLIPFLNDPITSFRSEVMALKLKMQSVTFTNDCEYKNIIYFNCRLIKNI